MKRTFTKSPILADTREMPISQLKAGMKFQDKNGTVHRVKKVEIKDGVVNVITNRGSVGGGGYTRVAVIE